MALKGTQGRLGNKIANEIIRQFRSEGFNINQFQARLINLLSQGIAQAIVPHLIGNIEVNGDTDVADIAPPIIRGLGNGKIT